MASNKAWLFVLMIGFSSATLAQDKAANDVAQYREAVSKLHWVQGPASEPVFDIATLEVPKGYVFLSREDTKQFMLLNQNPSSGNEYLLAPQDRRWFSVLSFHEDGYVKDDEKIDADGILESIREGTASANEERRKRGWTEMTIVGWKVPPHYDSETKRLEWAIDGRSGGESVINFNTKILGRGGVTSAILVADPQDLDGALADFKGALRGYDYKPSQRYADYKPGDKVAEYGLAALVAGGAAAVAVKTGLWKTLLVALAAGWKFIAAGAVALFAGIGKLLKRNKN